ncbi:hypothetical protein E2P61_06310 [Candidatus Bathyarchaeota archaeon]|nr:hypothetical protein E2P61_06310 [Candidatus Bathyarchaeota archaeon]
MRRFDFGRELLKVLAIVTMVIDHAGRILYPDLLFLQMIGRLSFPIFAYLIVLGVESTKKPLKYMVTLLLFAVFSQFPYFLAFGIEPFERLNILFSLLLSAITLYFYDKRSPITLFPLLASMILPTEGSYYVVLTAIGMKLLKDTPKLGTLVLFALNLQFLLLSSEIHTQIQILSLLAVPLIFLHIKNRLTIEILIPENSFVYSLRKYFFYVFYPLHLTLLFFISMSSV